MKAAEIENFFKTLNDRIDFPVRVILTGGAAGIVQGVERATKDIDFEAILIAGNQRTHWEKLGEAVRAVAQSSKIAAQYATDIDRWSSIALPAKTSWRYLKFSKVEVRILNPELWAIGKLARYLQTDVQDLKTVLKKSRISAEKAVTVWGTALRKSPQSSAVGLFKKQVERFLDNYSQEIWGKKS